MADHSATSSDVTRKLIGKNNTVWSHWDCIKLCKNSDKRIASCVTAWSYVEDYFLTTAEERAGLPAPKRTRVCRLYDASIAMMKAQKTKRFDLHEPLGGWGSKGWDQSDYGDVSIVTKINCYSKDERKEIQENAWAHWVPVITCGQGYGGTLRDGKFQCSYKETYGFQTRDTKGSTTSSSSSKSTQITDELGFSAGVQLEFSDILDIFTARVNMEASTSWSHTDGFDWSTSTSANKAFTTVMTTTKHSTGSFEVGPGETAVMCQPEGHLGDFVVKPRHYHLFRNKCCSENASDCNKEDSWKEEASSSYCTNQIDRGWRAEKKECQDSCDDSPSCVGYSWMSGPTFNRNCYLCRDDTLKSTTLFNFYRKPGVSKPIHPAKVICNDNLTTSNVQEIAANRKSECKDCGTSKSKCDSSQCILDEGWIWNSCVAKNG
jgi:hypothetical protein